MKYLIGMLLLLVTATSKAEVDPPPYSDMVGKELSTVECLAVNLYHESRGESDIANMVINSVVQKRVDMGGRYGENVCEVVFNNAAFSWTQDGKSDKIVDVKRYRRLYYLSELFLMNKEVFMDLAEGVDHYHRYDIKPDWDWSKLELKFRLDDHLFYEHL